MADAYKVTAPYIIPKVRDDAGGGWVHRGYYKDAVIQAEQIDPDSLSHHLDGGMLAEVEVPAVEVDVPAEPQAKVDGPPAGNASRDAWAAYAAGKGAPEEETRPVDEGGLGRDELRTRYGN